MYFNDYINDRRKQLNMSVDELVVKSGIPKGTLSKITAGINTNPTLSTIEALCKALNCTIDDAVCQQKNIAPAESSENDVRKKKLLCNYEKMNETGKDKLVKYSDFMLEDPDYLKESDKTISMNA